MMNIRGSGSSADDGIDKLSFDDHRIPRSSQNDSDSGGHHGLLRDDVSLLSVVVDGVIERDRQRLRRRIIRYTSFAGAVLCWFAFPLRSRQ
jgi:hypothetical protein